MKILLQDTTKRCICGGLYIESTLSLKVPVPNVVVLSFLLPVPQSLPCCLDISSVCCAWVRCQVVETQMQVGSSVPLGQLGERQMAGIDDTHVSDRHSDWGEQLLQSWGNQD